ncbi:MAG: methionyl-tRNA formyltransferase [Gammaproteobacteria bacterium]|nr:methionyl-tRNA formyltransferase [Gammaproteobacteria bacterium]
MTRARVVFAGTSDFSVPSLDALTGLEADLVAVYCPPDRPAGRGRILRPCAVKERALALGLEVRQPSSLKGPQAAAELEALGTDLMVVVAYGLVLPRAVLAAPRLGCVNVHASLLPRWRGAAPIQRAIEAGDAETGVTLMQMDAGLDTGAVLARKSTAIKPHDTAGTLHERLSSLGADLLSRSFEDIVSGALEAVPQDESAATYARKIERSEALVDWSSEASVLERRVRAFNPRPLCYTGAPGGGELKILEAAWSDRDTGAIPGTVVRCAPNGIDVACGQGVLTLLVVQRSGARAMPVADFLNGASLAVGDVLAA